MYHHTSDGRVSSLFYSCQVFLQGTLALTRIRAEPLAGAVALAFLSAASAQPLTPPPASLHLREARYEAMFLKDEFGKVRHNGLLQAIAQKEQMQVDPQAWPGTGSRGPVGVGESLTAGIDSAAWTWLGPGNVGGRIRAIVVNPTNTSIMWAGGVAGGVWKTLNGGASWAPLNDFMANLAIGCLVLDPTNPNVIYAGTGEGFSNSDAIRGAGIFKSTDGGASWAQLAFTATSSFYNVNRLAVSPTNNLFLIAATGTGIWRSTDGGATWSQRYSTRSVLDIAVHPTDGGLCIASGSTFGATGMALYSTDAGVTWNTATGLPTSGRIEIAYALSSPTTVYASANNNSGEVYMSSDGGVTYTFRSTGYNYLGSQGWYDNCIWVDPTNPNLLVVGGTDLYRSIDGGITFTDIGGYTGGVHPDQHAIVNIPTYDGAGIKTVFIGNDGGFFRATDISTVTSSSGWTKLNNNLGITQYYGAAGNASSGTVVGGTQDNGTQRLAGDAGTSSWTSMFGGDGGYCAADQSDPNYFYGEYVYLQIHRSSNAGQSSSYIYSGIGDAGLPDPDPEPLPEGEIDPDSSANFIAPFILDPNNFNTLLAGGSNLWRSVNVKAGSPTWTNIKPGANGSFISAIAVAPGNSDIIWVGHNNGDVYSTSNGTAANPTWVREDLGTPNLPNRNCTRLTIDPSNYNRIFATFGGYNSDNVYRTLDGGSTWANIATGLPSAPVRSLVLAPFNTSFVYVGTDVGVFASANGGASWSPGNEGAANVAVDELFWLNNYLVMASHGRGLFKILVSPAPVISLYSSTLAAEGCPPGNGVIDPNETVTLNFALTNLAAIATTNLTATLLATNGVSSPSGAQNYGAIIRGSAAATRAFTFVATGQCGGTITAVLQLVDGTNSLGNVSASFPLGSPSKPLSQNFDAVSPPALPAGWTVSSAGPVWNTTSGVSDTAPNSVFAFEPTAPSDDSLVSPVFAVAGASAQLTFRHNYQTETTYDGGVLEIAIAGGAFNDIISAGGSFVAHGYTQQIQPTDSVLVGRNTWSGDSGGFITTTVNLPAAATGHTVQLRWRFATDTGNSIPSTGWYVDTISVIDGYTCCVGTAHPSINSISRAGNTVSLTWSATPSVSYRVQYNTNLAISNWTDVAGDVTAGGPTASKTDTNASNARRFYRVRPLP